MEATFNGVPYCGSIVNMGVKKPNGSICYILGVRKAIQKAMDRYPGDTILVTVRRV